MGWMDRFSLERMVNPDPIRDRALHGPNPERGEVLGGRLASLQRQKSRMLRSQSASPLGENAPGFYEDMAAINQAIPALGQLVANPKKGLQFADAPRVQSTPNQTQARWALERQRDNALSARADAAQARDLEIGNTENALSIANEMADPAFGNMDYARPRAALARQYSRR